MPLKTLIFLIIFVNYCGGTTDETKKNIIEEEKHSAADSVLDFTDPNKFELPRLRYTEYPLSEDEINAIDFWGPEWEAHLKKSDKIHLENRVAFLEYHLKMNELTHKAALQNMMKLVNALIFTLAKQKTGEEQLKTTFFTFTDGDEGRERNVAYKYPDEWTFDVFDKSGHKKPYNYKWDLRRGDGKIVKVFGEAENKKEIKVEEKFDVANGKSGGPRVWTTIESLPNFRQICKLLTTAFQCVKSDISIRYHSVAFELLYRMMLSIDHPEIKKSIQQAKHTFQQLDAAAAPVVSPKSPKHSPLWPKSPSKVVNSPQTPNNVLPPVHNSPLQQPIQVQ